MGNYITEQLRHFFWSYMYARSIGDWKQQKESAVTDGAHFKGQKENEIQLKPTDNENCREYIEKKISVYV